MSEFIRLRSTHGPSWFGGLKVRDLFIRLPKSDIHGLEVWKLIQNKNNIINSCVASKTGYK